MIEELIDKLIRHKIHIELEGQEHLKLNHGVAGIPDALLAEIKSRKQELIGFLAKHRSADNMQPIPRAPLQENYPLSSGQKSLWVLCQFAEANIVYNLPVMHVWNGDLNAGALAKAFRALIERHEILRTGFSKDRAGEIRQFIRNISEIEFTIDVRDLREAADAEAKAGELVQQALHQPFDLAADCLLRAGLFRITDQKWIISLVVHHIIADAWSLNILIKELLSLYLSGDDAHTLKPLAIQYKDYAVWQQEQVVNGQLSIHRTYWLQQLQDELPVLSLPKDGPHPSAGTYNGATVNRLLSAELSEALHVLCRKKEATLFMALLALVNALLYKYTGQQDFIIGSPIAGRDHADLEEQIGFYVNLLTLRTQFEPTESFAELLAKVKQVTLDAYQHQAYPFSELIDALDLHREPGRNPLFDVSVIVQNNASQSGSNAGTIDNDTAKFDLTFSMADMGTGIEVGIAYNNDSFKKETITGMLGHLVELLHAVVRNSSTEIKDLEYLCSAEKNKILSEFNNPAAFFPKDKTVLDLFAGQVRQLPDAPAVIFENSQLSYEELNRRSDILSSYLRTKGLGHEMAVAVSLERGIDILVAMLGIMKAGGVYVPVDPEYPLDRIRLVVNDTCAQWMISNSRCDKAIAAADKANLILLDKDWPRLTAEALPLPPLQLSPRQLAYVIYTSGSTGKPKGVMVEHKGLANMVFNHIDFLGLYPGQRVLQFASFTFDGSCHEIFCTLASGGALVMLSKEEIHNPVLLGQVIRKHKVEMATFPPSYQEIVKEELSGLKELYSAGEAMHIDLGRKMLAAGIQLINGYGPTENSVTATLSREPVRDDGQVTIGKPIKNVQIYILDENRQLLPVGINGELYIGGDSLARGYLNDAELTAAKFIKDPFSSNENARLYRTGDIGRWLPDGNIIYLGRKDEQVKIRGYRIELNEIVNVLKSLPGIQSAAVVARENSHGEKELIAYISGILTCDVREIREQLTTLVPFYMLPAHIIPLQQMPLLTNGKINKKLLPDPATLNNLPGLTFIAPRNETEESLVLLWQKILNKKTIGVTDNFFELGGSSLKAMTLIRELVRTMNISLPIKALFEGKTIERIAAYIQQAESNGTMVSLINNEDPVPLVNDISYNQQSYFADWDNKGEYIVVISYRHDQLDVDACWRAMLNFIGRHEMFRTRFVKVNGTIKQEVLSIDQLELHQPDIIYIADKQALQSIIEQEHQTRFDLFSGPLFSLKIIHVANSYHYVVLTMHHILADGYSEGIIKSELTGLYAAELGNPGLTPASLRFQYRHFARWQHKFLNTPEGFAHKNYWLKKLHGFPGPLKLFSHLPALGHGNNVIAIATIIENNLYNDLDRYVRQHELTRAGLLMSCLVLVCNRLTAQEDITILMPVSGRNAKHYGALDVSGLTGDFTNLLAIRNRINQNDSIHQYISKVQTGLLEDLEYEAYPFGRLLKELPGIEPDFSLQHTVSFNYHNYHFLNELVYEGGENGDEIKRPGDIPIIQAFSLAVTEYSNCLQLHLVFNENLFNREARTTILHLYLHILKQAVYSSQTPVHQIGSPVV